MDKANHARFKLKKQIFGVSKSVPKQSSIDSFLAPKSSRLTAEKENKRSATLSTNHIKPICLEQEEPKVKLTQTQDDDILLKLPIRPSYAEEDIDKLFDDVEVNPRNDCFVEKGTAGLTSSYANSQDLSWPYDSCLPSMDADRSPVLTNKKKCKKFGKIYQDMDYGFDYTDWSENKKKHESTPRKKHGSPKFDSVLDFANEKDGMNSVRRTMVTNESETKKNSVSQLEPEWKKFALDDEFDVDFNDAAIVVESPKRNANCRTPVKCPQSPDLFDPSPECKVAKSEIFAKNFCLLRPGQTKQASTSSQSAVIDSTISPDFTKSAVTYSKVDDGCSANQDTRTLSSVKEFLEAAQKECFGNIGKNNSLLQVESNLDVLRSYEKKILDATFEWFTSLPTFVAEQIHYVLDANELTKLKMFRTRIRERIAEAEAVSLEKLAEDSPKEHEKFCRIEQKITFLSEAMKSLKNVVASSPTSKKCGNERKAVAVHPPKSDANLGRDLFSSDNDCDDDDEKMASKKPKRNANYEANRVPVVVPALKRSTFDSTDFEQLPSTQDIDRVFDQWKDSKDQRLLTKRPEKRKRAESNCKKSGVSPAPSACSSRTIQVADRKAREINRVLFDGVVDGGDGKFKNDDDVDDSDDFPDFSDSQLFDLALKNGCSAGGTVANSGDQLVGRSSNTTSANDRISNATDARSKAIDTTACGATVKASADRGGNDANGSHDDRDNVRNSLAAAFDETFEPKTWSSSRIRDSASTSKSTPPQEVRNRDSDTYGDYGGSREAGISTSAVSITDRAAVAANAKFKFKAPCFGGVVASVETNTRTSTNRKETNAQFLNDTASSDDRLFDELFQSQPAPTCTKDSGCWKNSRFETVGNVNVVRGNNSLPQKESHCQNQSIVDNLFDSDEEFSNDNGGGGAFESDSAIKSTAPAANAARCDAAASITTSTTTMNDAAERMYDGDASVVGKFLDNFPNDGITGEFSRNDYPHSAELNRIFRTRFGLHKFRPIQLEAINAALLGHDCFILMPTGGGKSLCYQLPALLTAGVTVVISPLKSLIIDQSEKLKALDIAAAHLLGEVSATEASNIYGDLCRKEPNLKMLYVTPEKVASSVQLQNVFCNLYNRKLLSRFVIDEAHCVSQWGHDFRTDYKKLCSLRQNYPHVPIMALTATATARVRNDILHQLNIRSPKWFISSFNRPNLKYQVVPKKGSKSSLEEIIGTIKTKFARQCGILYCLSRKECDSCAETLRKSGIKAESYHAGLSDKQRNDVQSKWVSNKFQIVCATIAFGMGIDKPDVRFVIHYSLPKSIEGYYQESGRAGRDGKISWCILYYSYQDMHRIKKLIQLGDGNQETKAVHFSNLWRIVRFCENKTDCRRSLQLNYFGELFKRDACVSNADTICDNCAQINTYKIRDVTEDCQAIVRAVGDICGQMDCNAWNKNFTTSYIADVFKGAKTQKILQSGHVGIALHGRGKTWNRVDIDRLLHQLTLDGYLQEKMVANREEIVLSYIKLGAKADDLLSGKVKITFPMTESASSKSNVREHSSRIENAINSQAEELHENCYQELMEARNLLGEQFNLKTSSVMTIEAIQMMSLQLPTTEEEMLMIDGVTKANFDKFGKFMLKITSAYAIKKQEIALSEKQQEPNGMDGNDETEALRWNDATATSSPYFSSPMSSNTRVRNKSQTNSQKTYKRKFRRRKKLKTSPSKKRTKKYGASKTKKSPAKPLAQNRALMARKLGFLPCPQPKQYAHCGSAASASSSKH